MSTDDAMPANLGPRSGIDRPATFMARSAAAIARIGPGTFPAASAIPPNKLAAVPTIGAIAAPTVMSVSFTWFHAILIWLPADSYRLAASSASAEFAAHASPAVLFAAVTVSVAFARRENTDAFSVPRRPTCFNASATSPPDATTPFRPCRNICIAWPGSSRHAAANSSAVTPAMSENCSSFAPPSITALLIPNMARDIADPPSSASIPTDDIDAARPSIADSDMPTVAAAPARRVAMLVISASVEAVVLPSATIVAPMREMPVTPSRAIVPITLLIRAIDVAA